MASLLLAPALAVSMSAQAHIDLQSPPPRYLDGYSGQKTGPCGAGAMASGVVTEWTAGEQVTIIWEETINHTGHYRIALDPTGTDNFNNPDPPSNDAVVGNTLVFVPDESAQDGNEVSATITVPDYDCDPCTLQVLQYMANSANPFYYFCADVKITGDGGGSTTTGSGAGVGGGGQGGSGMGGDDGGATSSSGYGTYPQFTPASDGGCAIGGSRSSGMAGLLLLAAAALWRRRR